MLTTQSLVSFPYHLFDPPQLLTFAFNLLWNVCVTRCDVISQEKLQVRLNAHGELEAQESGLAQDFVRPVLVCSHLKYVRTVSSVGENMPGTCY